MERQQIVYKFIKSINEHNVDKIYDLMTDNFKFIDAYGNEEIWKKHMRNSWIGYFKWFPDYEIEVVEIFSEDDNFVILGFASGTYQNRKTDNKENYWRLPASWKAIVIDNKIDLWQVYCDSKIPYEIIERNEQINSRLTKFN